MSPAGPIAIDTSVLVRASTRRLLCAIQEVQGSNVIIPAEVVREAPRAYRGIAARHSRREVEWEAARRWERPWDERQRAELIGEAARRTVTRVKGLTTWLDGEARRNDSPYRLPASIPEDEALAAEVAAAGWGEASGEGGDPKVLAQALRDGARVVATENMRRVLEGELDEWLRLCRRDGRFAAAATPFVVTPDDWVSERLHEGSAEQRDWRVLVHAWAVMKPHGSRTAPEQVAARLHAAAAHLDADGSTRTAEWIRPSGWSASSTAGARGPRRSRRGWRGVWRPRGAPARARTAGWRTSAAEYQGRYREEERVHVRPSSGAKGAPASHTHRPRSARRTAGGSPRTATRRGAPEPDRAPAALHDPCARGMSVRRPVAVG